MQTTANNMKLKATDREILHMHKHGMSYGMIASLVGTSRQNIHRIVKYKKRPNFLFRVMGYEIGINKVKGRK